MAWIETLRGQIVALDTAPLIYFIEDHPKYADAVGPFFDSLASGDFQAITSVITLYAKIGNQTTREAALKWERDGGKS